MNVPVDQRIDQIRVNLERQRWYLHALEDEFILVNIAGFNVLWVKDDAIEWEQIAQVGKEFTQTPVFKDEIEYLDFNPTWTIPPGILNRTVIPNLKKDPGYLDKKGYELLTLQGQPVDPSKVDWKNLQGFPYLVRQPPGPNNALGLVKFMFPNPHLVFLHDTNARHLFDRPRRLFSSGCIRVKEPFDLAERLLRDKDGWDRARIDEVVASGKTTRVRLDEPMPIIIGYTTAVARDGQVVFREDIYDRDQGVLDALNAEFRIRNQDSSR
jgi:murein L,D-transpeptidase YcbB/YkuD